MYDDVGLSSFKIVDTWFKMGAQWQFIFSPLKLPGKLPAVISIIRSVCKLEVIFERRVAHTYRMPYFIERAMLFACNQEKGLLDLINTSLQYFFTGWYKLACQIVRVIQTKRPLPWANNLFDRYQALLAVMTKVCRNNQSCRKPNV